MQGEPGFLGPQGEPGLPGLPGTKVGDFSSSLWCCLSQRGRYFLLRVTRWILRAGNDEAQTLWLMVITSYQPDRRWNREFLWVSVLITLHSRFPSRWLNLCCFKMSLGSGQNEIILCRYLWVLTLSHCGASGDNPDMQELLLVLMSFCIGLFAVRR